MIILQFFIFISMSALGLFVLGYTINNIIQIIKNYFWKKNIYVNDIVYFKPYGLIYKIIKINKFTIKLICIGYYTCDFNDCPHCAYNPNKIVFCRNPNKLDYIGKLSTVYNRYKIKG